MSDLQKIGALWSKTSKDGKTQFWSGEIELNGEKVRLTVFRNGYKTEDKHPVMVIYLSPEEEVKKPAPAKGAKKGKKEAPEPEPPPEDDIPF